MIANFSEVVVRSKITGQISGMPQASGNRSISRNVEFRMKLSELWALPFAINSLKVENPAIYFGYASLNL